MNPDQEKFESLRKLLALKRHEQPPPGYFRSFSNNVMARINARDGDAEGVWLLSFWRGLLARPLLSGALGAAAFGLLVFGVVFSKGDAAPASAGMAPFNSSMAAIAPGQDKTPAQNFFDQFSGSASEDINSTNPIAPKPPSMFNPVGVSLEKVSYQPQGR